MRRVCAGMIEMAYARIHGFIIASNIQRSRTTPVSQPNFSVEDQPHPPGNEHGDCGLD
jgi:hypothetical protein